MKEDQGSTAKVVPIREGQGDLLPLRGPIQMNLFTKEATPIPLVVDRHVDEELKVSDEIVLARTGDASQLVLSGFGLFVSKKAERLLVRKGKDLLYEFPFYRLSEVTLASRGITISSDLIMELCDRGIQINFLHGSGKPYAKITAPTLFGYYPGKKGAIQGPGRSKRDRIFQGCHRRQAQQPEEPSSLFRQVHEAERGGAIQRGNPGCCHIEDSSPRSPENEGRGDKPSEKRAHGH